MNLSEWLLRVHHMPTRSWEVRAPTCVKWRDMASTFLRGSRSPQRSARSSTVVVRERTLIIDAHPTVRNAIYRASPIFQLVTSKCSMTTTYEYYEERSTLVHYSLGLPPETLTLGPDGPVLTHECHLSFINNTKSCLHSTWCPCLSQASNSPPGWWKGFDLQSPRLRWTWRRSLDALTIPCFCPCGLGQRSVPYMKMNINYNQRHSWIIFIIWLFIL